jgi:hypothetical protein
MKRKINSPTIAIEGNPLTDPINLSKPIDINNDQIAKEIEALATSLDQSSKELQAWVDLQIEKSIDTPAKTILHLLRTANRYRLDPLQGEVILSQYEQNWQVSIGIDGWIKLINQHPAFTGIAFTESAVDTQGTPVWIECTIHRSDRVVPTTIREYYCEVKNDSEIWNKMPRRMLRYRSLQQCARLAMGIAPPERHEEIQKVNFKLKTEIENSTETNSAKTFAGMKLLKIKLEPSENETSN